MFSNILPTDEFTDNAPEEASPAPESTSGYGPADHLDPGSTEPTLEPDALEFITETVTVFPQTEATPSQDEPTQADAGMCDPGVAWQTEINRKLHTATNILYRARAANIDWLPQGRHTDCWSQDMSLLPLRNQDVLFFLSSFQS